MEIEKLEIAKLDLKDGDILAVIVREEMSDSSMATLQHKLDETFKPLGVKGVVFCGDFELKVIAPHDKDYPDITLCH